MTDAGRSIVFLPPQYLLIVAQVGIDKHVTIVGQRITRFMDTPYITVDHLFGSCYRLIQPVLDFLIRIGQRLVVERVVLCTVIFLPRSGKQRHFTLQGTGYIAVYTTGSIGILFTQVRNGILQILQDIIHNFRTCITRTLHQFGIRVQLVFYPGHTSVIHEQVIVVSRTEVIRLAQTLLVVGSLLFAVLDILKQEIHVTYRLVITQLGSVTQRSLAGQTRIDCVRIQVITVGIAESDTVGTTIGLRLDGSIVDRTSTHHRHAALIEHIQVHVDFTGCSESTYRRHLPLRFLIHVEAGSCSQA